MKSELEKLKDLSYVAIDSVPDQFRPALLNSVIGETLQKIDGKIVVSKKMFNDWLSSYEIQETHSGTGDFDRI